MGVALEHYKRACAGRMGSREQRRCRERPIDRDEDRFAAPEIVEHRGDAVGHCSSVGSAPHVTGSDAPVPGWSRKISRPSDVIASTHP
jgi:hypothetical protein